MDTSLIIFLVVVIFFTFRGYQKGLLKSLSRVLGLIAGYAAAILFSKSVTPLVEAWFELQGIVAYLIAAASLFIAASLMVSLIFWVINNILSDADASSTGSRIGGAAVGMLTGSLIAIVVVWTFNFLSQISQDGDAIASADNDSSPAARLVNQVAGFAVGTALSAGSSSPEVARLTTAMLQSPGEISQQAQRLANSNDLQELLIDPQNQNVLSAGDVAAVRQLPAFQRLANNPDMIALAETAGMLEQNAEPGQGVDQALAENITDIWGKAQRVKNDRRVQEILADPEFRQKLNSGNPIDMLSNQKLLELANIVFSEETTAGSNSNNPGDVNSKDNSAEKAPTQIYSWTDDNGRTHYSDTAPAD